ncbi:hypothetical protein BR93DRAFT_63435 [Coniochaeta sp. PMI_546]|nr:hypothetical protein BR93DRAFT_63435 [Coniochaeta sp. PMI_546]
MGNHRQQPPAGAAHPPPASPTAKATSKYTNKDGSKFITVPKANSSTTDSAQPSPSLDPPDSKTAAQSEQAGPGSPASVQPVNQKKQKRREKERAKALAKQGLNKPDPPSPTDSAAPSHDRRSLDVEHDFSEAEDEHDHHPPQENGTGTEEPTKSKKAKKNKKKKAAAASVDDTHSHNDYHDHHDHHDHMLHHERSHNHAPHPPPAHRGSGISKEKIWNTSSQEERQRIKDFWLGLGEDERKSLVKVEKDAVLKKMKEQQKHTCSCTVCGRKRTAIEEELEGLYDAYYEELEQYAHHPNQNGEGPPMMGSPKRFGNRVGSSRGPPSNYPHQPSHGRIVEHVSDDEDDEGEEYESEEEPDEDDGYDEDEPPEVNNRNDYASDFFAFGNSLTVQGGILTVADDLLKNDGRKFIEMMEQLAERRMAREEDAKEAYSRNYGHTNGGGYGHSHLPPEEEEYEEDDEEFEEDDEEEYDSQEEEDAMTEEQRMEEGRRMFQIFAARMFEQRVLTAYREKVAKERQQKLIEELEVEERTKDQRKAKKAKEAQKRKDKAAKKKEALAEEKARKEAEKAAEEEARRAEEARKAEEQRQKAEEKRKKKEAQRKAEEEERLRKEAERQRQKEKQAEQERKAREAKEKEKKAKEEAARQKEKEAKERKELEMRERKEQQEREKKEREAKNQADREAKEKLAQAQQKALQNAPKQADPAVHKPNAALPTATPITLVKRPAQHTIPTAVPALPQQPATSTPAVASPQIAIATPAIPKAPLNMRNRQPSQQESTSGSSQAASQSESNLSQAPSPHPLTPSHTSPGPLGPASKMGAQHPSQGASPMNIPTKTTTAPHFGGFSSSPMMSFGQAPPGMHPIPPPGFGSPMHQNPAFAPNPFAPFGSPGMVGLPGGISRPIAGRPFAHPTPPPGFNNQALDSQFSGMGQGFQAGPPRDSMPLHNRQGSIGVDHQSPSMSSTQPIGKPMPIGRPPSVAPGQRPAASLPNAGWGGNVIESQHLGSSALLADSVEAAEEMPPSARRNTSVHVPGMQFPNMFNMDPMFNNPWGPQPVGQQGFYGSPPPPGFAGQHQSAPWGTPGQTSSAFGLQNGLARQGLPRSVTIRQLLCRACKELVESPNTPSQDQLDNGYVSLKAVKSRVDQLEPTTDKELLEICDTLGNSANGGGSFETRTASNQIFVRWMPEPTGVDGHPLQRAIGAPGEIRSPAVGSRVLSSGNGLGGN